MTFNPQVGNTRLENDNNLQRHIDLLGGMSSTLNPMQQSLTENELRYMGKNTLDPKNNNMLNPESFNPYATQAGMIGANSMAGIQAIARSIRQPNNEVSQLEIGRMMRAEREQQMNEHEKINQRFGSFNKMLKGSIPGGSNGGSAYNL